MPEIKVVYEDKNFLAVDKPAGVLVHKVQSSKFKDSEETLADWLLKKYPEVKKVGDEPALRPGIVHRLDKNTSGAILIARNQTYFDYLKNLFEKNEVKKTYLVLVWGKIESKTGIIRKPIGILRTVKRTVTGGKMVKEAITEYEVIKFLKLKKDKEKEQIFSLLKVMPKTGRTHQIRIHLASIGHPLVGDELYGPKQNPFNLKRQFLHAESLEFNLPDGGRMKIEAELPDDLKNILKVFDNTCNT